MLSYFSVIPPLSAQLAHFINLDNFIMSPYQANLSNDGHTYTKQNGLVEGLRTYGVIKPERKIRQGDDGNVWEAIVIGAGYAGLIAARDLVKAGEFLSAFPTLRL